MFTILSIRNIKEKLLTNKQSIRNFPKSVSFPFPELYKDIVTQIKTIEISSECIVFDSVKSFNETKEFSNPDYWSENTKETIESFWFFAQNGQGDFWLFDNKNKVYFYDHNQEEMSIQNFTDLGLNFEKWLQFAYLNKQPDEVYETEDEITEVLKAAYKQRLEEISGLLLEKHPFEI
ncbi:SMI1/KNR4 family protein [Flavobacterium foetidum]|uniref:SMI1/KNR4 family protein n=1 Tax=Flavobacterium foetidum TaxID=2026681 RepID=UPI001074D6C1|nr:SMI1/KNR4 family protein [Flavobacterium foetidum]KAF2507267.1 SMI1/KNR4 family protein [Flavobacterium foetidum]